MALRGSLGTVLCACGVVVRGTSNRGSCVLRIAAGDPPDSGTTTNSTSVFELPGLFSSWYFTSFAEEEGVGFFKFLLKGGIILIAGILQSPTTRRWLTKHVP